MSEIERLRALVRTNFDLYHEAMTDVRAMRDERDALRVERETLREDETVQRITDNGDVQQVFDWYLNGGEHQRSVDDWCETCSTPEGPVYHDPWPETSESDVVRAVLTVLVGDDQ